MPQTEDKDEWQSKWFFMGALPDLRRENKNQSLLGHSSCPVSAILPQMQKGDAHRCHTIKDGIEQMSRTL